MSWLNFYLYLFQLDTDACKCCGGPECKFRPCDCGDPDEETSWQCNDICCCECNFKQPHIMPHATPSTHVKAQSSELMNEISRLSTSGYKLQLIGPDGQVRTIDTSAAPHSSTSQVPSVMSSPELATHRNVINAPPRGYVSHPGLPHHLAGRAVSRQGLGTITRQPALQRSESLRPVSVTHDRVLPPIPAAESQRPSTSSGQFDGSVRKAWSRAS